MSVLWLALKVQSVHLIISELLLITIKQACLFRGLIKPTQYSVLQILVPLQMSALLRYEISEERCSALMVDTSMSETTRVTSMELCLVNPI
jgi:hypothetical protein